MIFEIGKCYKHTTGSLLKIIGAADSTMYGLGLVAEHSDITLSIVGNEECHTANYTKISDEEWMRNFSKD